MAATPIEIPQLPAGLTGLTCDVYAPGVDAPLQSAIALAAEDSRTTTYAGVVTAAASGVVQILVKHSDGTPIDDRFSVIADTTDLQVMYEHGNLASAIDAGSTVVVSSAAFLAADDTDTGLITIVRYTTFTRQITGLGSLTNRAELYFSIKRSPSQDDDDSLIRISEGTGLERINGAAAGDAAGASLVVDDQDDGDVTITMVKAITSTLPLFDNAAHDFKIIRTNGDVDVLTSVDYPSGASTRARSLNPVTHALT
jgi:hypothetical protein